MSRKKKEKEETAPADSLPANNIEEKIKQLEGNVQYLFREVSKINESINQISNAINTLVQTLQNTNNQQNTGNFVELLKLGKELLKPREDEIMEKVKEKLNEILYWQSQGAAAAYNEMRLMLSVISKLPKEKREKAIENLSEYFALREEAMKLKEEEERKKLIEDFLKFIEKRKR